MAILDTVARTPESRAAWRATAEEAGAAFRFIECVCSDANLHRARIEERVRGIPGWGELSWHDVEAVRARSKPWDDERLVLDVVNPVAANVADAVRYSRFSGETRQRTGGVAASGGARQPVWAAAAACW